MIRLNLRRFRKKIDVFPIPTDFELIEKQKRLDVRVPIHLADDLNKVKRVPFGITIQQELKTFNETTYTSGPFYHYQLDNILLLKNRIYFDGYEYLLNPLQRPVRIYDSKDVVEYSNVAFSSMRISTVFFGHWLHEELMLIDYLQGKKDIVTSSPTTPQKEEIACLFELDFHVNEYARIKVADMYEGWQHTSFYIKTLQKYKEKISILSFGKIKTNRPKAVYLKRGKSSSKRHLENEDALLDFMSKEFEVRSFIAEEIPIKELYTEIYRADLILGIEGSQLAHGIIAGKSGAVLLCIQPPYRFYNPFKNYCADAGLHYAVFVAEQSNNEDVFNINIERFKLLLEKVVKFI